MLMQNRERDAPVHGGHQLAAAALAEVGQADGDDEKGFESFAESDDECLQHGHGYSRRHAAAASRLDEIQSQFAV